MINQTDQLFNALKKLTLDLVDRGYEKEKAVLFIIKMVICLYFQGLGLINKAVVIEIVNDLNNDSSKCLDLFNMASKVWVDSMFFQGEQDVIHLTKEDVSLFSDLIEWDWVNIDSMIFGKLHELMHSTESRSKHGAFYTHDRDMMMKIINPVIVQPLLNEWEEVKASIRECLSKAA